jgi:hypothetical protein
MARVTFEAFIGIAFAAVGAGVLTSAAVNLFYAVVSRTWRRTAGVIIGSRVHRAGEMEGGDLYRAEVSYFYSVGGEEFVGRRTRFGEPIDRGWSGPAVRIVRQYAVGGVVSVHYNPDDPADAVLQPGLNYSLLARALLGAVFTASGVLLARWSL